MRGIRLGLHFGPSLGVQMLQTFELHGSSSRLTPTRSSAAGPRWGLRPLTAGTLSVTSVGQLVTVASVCHLPVPYLDGLGILTAFFGPSLGLQMLQSFQHQETSLSDSLTGGSAPGPRRGLRPQAAVIGSRSALAMSPSHSPSLENCLWAPVGIFKLKVDVDFRRRTEHETALKRSSVQTWLLLCVLYKTYVYV